MPEGPAGPRGRLGDPADYADVVLFLASEDSRFVTGQSVAVDGGGASGRRLVQVQEPARLERLPGLILLPPGLEFPAVSLTAGGSHISVSGLVPVGTGLDRPEHVLVTGDGRVMASDRASAVAEVRGDGTLRRIGWAGGEPNGFDVTGDGAAVLANFGHGRVQRIDLSSGYTATMVEGEIGGRSLRYANCAVIDRSGRIWVSVSTRAVDLRHAIVSGEPDGYLFVMEADGSGPTVVAESVCFPNCLTFDEQQQYLYVVRTVHADVVRFRVNAEGGLGPEEAYTPPLGGRRPNEFCGGAVTAMAVPGTMRRWGMADGCGFDSAGNLWVTLVSANRVVAVTPEREVVTVLDDPSGEVLRAPTSVAWGGADGMDVYFGSLSAGHLVKGRSSVPGVVRGPRRSSATSAPDRPAGGLSDASG